jgi:hypothetical protein
MPRTIDEGFRDFLATLTPSTTETNAAASHRASIDATLKANHGMTRLFRSGSFGNATSISGKSDVDYFAVLPTSRTKDNSYTTLTDVRNTLDARFPNTGVRLSAPAVRVAFGSATWEAHEIVPAREVGKIGVHPVYEINDRGTGWMKTSPDAHNEYVAAVDKKLVGKVRPLVRYIKGWKYNMNVPVRSFYLEMRIAKYAQSEATIDYVVDIYRVLKWLKDNNWADVQDPTGVTAKIGGFATDAQLKDATSKVDTAITRLVKIIAARKAEDAKIAFEYLGYLFGGQFPSYYR